MCLLPSSGKAFHFYAIVADQRAILKLDEQEVLFKKKKALVIHKFLLRCCIRLLFGNGALPLLLKVLIGPHKWTVFMLPQTDTFGNFFL